MAYNFENLMDIRNFPGLLDVNDRVKRFLAMTTNQLEAEKARAEKNFVSFVEGGDIATANKWRAIEADIDTAMLLKEDPGILDQPDITEIL